MILMVLALVGVSYFAVAFTYVGDISSASQGAAVGGIAVLAIFSVLVRAMETTVVSPPPLQLLQCPLAPICPSHAERPLVISVPRDTSQVAMTLWSYFATVFTKPGSVPEGWHPFSSDEVRHRG